MTREEFVALTERGTVLLDGATGSNYRAAGMPVGVCAELWALEHPEISQSLQRAYVDAGSQIIYAPTFTANRAGLAAHGMESRFEELNQKLVAMTREAVAGHAYVAGDLGAAGTSGMAYQELYSLYREQVKVLADAGVDLLGIETMLRVDEAAAALDAALSVCDLPVMCSMTLEADGNLLFGGSIADAVETLQEMGAAAVGLNCSVGPDQLEAVVSTMKQVARVPLIVKPNAGMPVIDEHGAAHYDMSPDRFAAAMQKLIWRGAKLVGGCCGTTPEHIRALRQIM